MEVCSRLVLYQFTYSAVASSTSARVLQAPPGSFLLDQLDCLRARWVHIANDNLGAMASEEKSCRAPDTGASPGDKRYFTRKVQLIIAHLSRLP